MSFRIAAKWAASQKKPIPPEFWKAIDFMYSKNMSEPIIDSITQIWGLSRFPKTISHSVVVGNVYKVETETADDESQDGVVETETSFFVLRELNDDGNHTIQWIYTIDQVEGVSASFSRYTTITQANGIVGFLSDHYQTLTDPDTWTSVAFEYVDTSQHKLPAITADTVYIMGTYGVHTKAVSNELKDYYITQLMTAGRNHAGSRKQYLK